MLIACPQCGTAYEIDAAAVGPTGRSVRCARCRTVWVATMVPDEPIAAHGKADEKTEESGDFTWSFAPDGDQGDAIPPVSAGEATPPEPPPSAERPDADAARPPVPLPLADAPTIVPALVPDAAPGNSPSGAPSDDIETLAARRARRARLARKRKPRNSPLTTVLIVGFSVLLAGVVAWRHDVVRLAPQTASLFRTLRVPVNIRGLVFENVKTRREVQDGMMVLVVEGAVVNVTKRMVEVPRLRFAMRNLDGHEIYAWTLATGQNVLDPGETFPFRTRLASPPADGREVIVRFFHRNDLIAGAR